MMKIPNRITIPASPKHEPHNAKPSLPPISRAATKTRPSGHDDDEISLLWTPGERLVELVHKMPEGLQFAIREGHPPIIRYATEFDSYKPLSWLPQYIGVGAIRFPSEAAKGVVLDKLAARIREFIHRYVDCTPQFESVSALYALHTWLYEKFHAVPYLRFIGLPGSGKSRATETIGAGCYRPLIMAGSATPAPMFRMIESLGGTLLIDEADFKQTQIGSDIIKVLNCGYQQNLPVTRMEKDEKGKYVPCVHEVFGPKIINGRNLFADKATESRCLPYSPHSTDRHDIPTQLPAKFHAEAQEIQNMALGWRMDNLDSFQVVETALDDLKGRAKQIVIPLLSIAAAMSPPVGDKYRADLLEYCAQLEEQAKVDRSDTVEGQLVAEFVRWKGKAPTCKDLVGKVRGGYSDDLRWLTPNRASAILRGMGFKTRHTNHGSEVSIDSARLGSHCERFGLDMPKPGDDRDDGDSREDTRDDWGTADEMLFPVL